MSIMLALKRPLWKIDAIEIQPRLHELALENARLCGVSVNFKLSDLRDYDAADKYDLIVSNPPWQKHGTGRQSKYAGRNISRHEVFCTMGDVLDCVQRNLSQAGGAILVYPEKREEDLRQEAENTLLDIISASFAAGLKDQKIFLIRHKGNSG